MSERVSLVVLCEDDLHQTFIGTFVRRMKIGSIRELRVTKAGGKGDVLKAFPQEVDLLRRSKARSCLIVVMDADERSDQEIVGALRVRLRQERMDEQYDDLSVLIVAPRWEMDNWALHLLGEPVDEARDRRAKERLGDRGREAGRLLADACKSGRLPQPSLPSLEAACRDWQTFRQRHGL